MCGKCSIGFQTAGKLCNHVVNQRRCKPPAPEVLAADGGGGDTIGHQLDQLAEQIGASVPGGFGDNSQPMDLDPPVILHASDNLDQILAAGGPPVSFIVNHEADGSLHIQSMP